jgi:phosphonopyruvate decarboxylase
VITPQKLLKFFKLQKIKFFCGVPDSVLKNLTNTIDADRSVKNFISTNEGSAISMGVGYNLSKNLIPCIYMQNSGLGNAINPLISIADKKVYSIPMLLIIGWRGAPNQKDEPQHEVQGKITLQILNLLKIKFLILKDDNDIKKINPLLKRAKNKKEIVAIIIKNKSLLKNPNLKKKIETKNNVNRSKFLDDLIKLSKKDTKFISSTGFNSRELYQIRVDKKLNKDSDFYLVGGMGHTAMVSLGVSLNSKKDVLCIDGDGSLLMHMGSILTFTNFGKKNLKYILLNNNVHESVGNQPTFSKNINFKLFSKALNFRSYFKISRQSETSIILKKFLKSASPSFLEVRTNNKNNYDLLRPTNLIDLKNKFKNSL